jgi:DNA-binding beta-propeller fold protein YncE
MNTPKLLIALLLAGGSPLLAQQIQLHQRVTRAWETAAELQTPESVLYYAENDVFFVSNIAGKPLDKDGNGFISILKADGKIHALRWIGGLNAPKGLGLFKKILFVTDIDQIVEIDLASERIQTRWTIPGAKFLNDIAIAPDGTVYVSDSNDNRLHRIYRGRPEVFLVSDSIADANGLLFHAGELYVGTSGRIVAVNPQTKAVRVVVEGAGYIDGLAAADPKGMRFIVSDFKGRVQIVEAGQPPTVLADSSAAGINAADIAFESGKRTLCVPTFGHNTVVAYKVKL